MNEDGVILAFGMFAERLEVLELKSAIAATEPRA
jgi:hypothetical protein